MGIRQDLELTTQNIIEQLATAEGIVPLLVTFIRVSRSETPGEPAGQVGTRIFQTHGIESNRVPYSSRTSDTPSTKRRYGLQGTTFYRFKIAGRQGLPKVGDYAYIHDTDRNLQFGGQIDFVNENDWPLVQYTIRDGDSLPYSYQDAINLGSGVAILVALLFGQPASLSGTLQQQVDLNGNLQARNSTLSGTIDIQPPVEIAGNLVAQPASLAGGISNTVQMSGALAGRSATISGLLSIGDFISVGGNLIAQPASVSDDVFMTSEVSQGNLVGQNATLSGQIDILGSVEIGGALQAQPAALSGAIATQVFVGGDLQAQPASLAGQISSEVHIDGSLAGLPATLTGVLTIGDVVTVSGALQAQPATLSPGLIESTVGLTGTLAAQPAALAGSIITEAQITGNLVAQNATTTGEITIGVTDTFEDGSGNTFEDGASNTFRPS